MRSISEFIGRIYSITRRLIFSVRLAPHAIFTRGTFNLQFGFFPDNTVLGSRVFTSETASLHKNFRKYGSSLPSEKIIFRLSKENHPLKAVRVFTFTCQLSGQNAQILNLKFSNHKIWSRMRLKQCGFINTYKIWVFWRKKSSFFRNNDFFIKHDYFKF